MSSLFRNIMGSVTTTPTVVLTATAVVKTVIYSSGITNIDSTTKADHFVTITVKRGGTTIARFDGVPVPYGSTFDVGKMSLEPADELRVFSDANSVLTYHFDFLEKG